MFFGQLFKPVNIAFLLMLCLLSGLIGCSGQNPSSADLDNMDIPADIKEIADLRGLTPDDIEAAVKTYHPSGMHDEYIMFSSGGHSGQIHVVGIPSMRLLKTIAVFH